MNTKRTRNLLAAALVFALALAQLPTGTRAAEPKDEAELAEG